MHAETDPYTRIDRLERELAEARKATAEAHQSEVRMEQRAKEAEAELARLREIEAKMKEYVEHQPPCPLTPDERFEPTAACTCGLDDVLHGPEARQEVPRAE